MIFLSFAEYCGCMLGFNLLAACFVGWVLRFLFETASTITRVLRGTETGFELHSEEVLCPCVFRRLSALQFTVWCTVASVGFSFLNALIAVTIYALFLVTCSNCAADDQRPVSISVLAVFHTFCLFTGYLLMFVTHFERLRLTFSGTAMQLPQWAPNVLYVILLAVVLLMTIFLAFRNTVPIVSALSLLLWIVSYFVSTAALVTAFFQKTMAVLNCADERDLEVTESTVRITVSVTVSLLSTTLSVSLWVVILALCPHCVFWRLLGVCLLTFDLCLNAFCLMCTFARAERYYKHVFGKLNALFLKHMSDTVPTPVSAARERPVTVVPQTNASEASSHN